MVGQSQLTGWDEWEAKIRTLAGSGTFRAATKALTVGRMIMQKELVRRTATKALPPRIRNVSLAVIGGRTMKSGSKTKIDAKFGYGLGKRTTPRSLSFQKFNTRKDAMGR